MTDGDVLEIEDGARGFDGVTGGFAGGWETLVDEYLVFTDETFEETGLGGQTVESVDVESTEGFDVDWSSVLKRLGEGES